MNEKTDIPWKKPLYSTSKRKTLSQCDLKFYHTYIAKTYPFKKGKAQAIGDLVDNELEMGVNIGGEINQAELYRKLREIDPKYHYLDGLVDGADAALNYVLNQTGIKITQQWWGVTRQCKPCKIPHYFSNPPPYTPKHFAKPKELFDVASTDVAILGDDWAKVYDYKSGNPNYPDVEQIEDYALHVMAHFKHINEVHGEILWLRQGRDSDGLPHRTEVMVKRSDLKKILTRWAESAAKVNRLNTARLWSPCRGPLCGWCNHVTCTEFPED